MNSYLKFGAILCGLVLAATSIAAETGGDLYATYCSQCHGKNREGAVGPNLVDATWIHGEPTKSRLIDIISKGVADKGMPAWSSVLNKQQLAQLADFLLTKPVAVNTEAASAAELAKIRVPKGFKLSVYADGVSNARGLAIDENDVVYVGSRKAGKVYALVDANKDGVADKVITVAEGLDSPIGVTVLNKNLYVAEVGRVIRFDDISKNYANKPAYKIVKDDLPNDRWHGEKIIKAGPDGKLYIPVGAPCNVCDKENGPHTKIYRMNPDGSDFKPFASGIRNSVGFTWHPQTQELWFTDNGRDELGDNTPSCELNRAPKAGMHFGFPYCHSGVLLDPEFGKGKSCSDYVAPVAQLGPHVAPLGLAFNTGNHFPAQYRNQLFVAEHGSWNRTQKIGYRVSVVTLAGNQLLSDTPFIEFLQDENVLGRPVDVAFLSDGSMLISDDDRGRVYRVTYTGNK
ncbi:PQQ-dependent sugar dehydrogenase [Cellvibrio zantedeschiae]|nr:PQQ-dependent sugar dehydrogenase [Cellvibrio zantedeschiae]